MQILRSAADLTPRKLNMKQIFLDQARYLQAQTHHEEQTDERISQTIVGIQSSEAKRGFFPGLPVRHLDRSDAPAEKNIAWTGSRTVSTSHILP